MKDDIINILKNSDKAMTIYELQDSLNLKKVEEIKELGNILRELEEEIVIYHTNKDRYMMLVDSQLKKGVMRANKRGFGFVEIEDSEEDIYVSQDDMNGALHDDLVLVEITSKKNIDRLEGRILKVIKRRENRYVGEISFKDDELCDKILIIGAISMMNKLIPITAYIVVIIILIKIGRA